MLSIRAKHAREEEKERKEERKQGREESAMVEGENPYRVGRIGEDTSFNQDEDRRINYGREMAAFPCPRPGDSGPAQGSTASHKHSGPLRRLLSVTQVPLTGKTPGTYFEHPAKER